MMINEDMPGALATMLMTLEDINVRLDNRPKIIPLADKDGPTCDTPTSPLLCPPTTKPTANTTYPLTTLLADIDGSTCATCTSPPPPTIEKDLKEIIYTLEVKCDSIREDLEFYRTQIYHRFAEKEQECFDKNFDTKSELNEKLDKTNGGGTR